MTSRYFIEVAEYIVSDAPDEIGNPIKIPTAHTVFVLQKFSTNSVAGYPFPHGKASQLVMEWLWKWNRSIRSLAYKPAGIDWREGVEMLERYRLASTKSTKLAQTAQAAGPALATTGVSG